MITLEFAVPVRKIYANQKVREDAGCVALMRGPMVYCFEGVDNPGLLQSFCLPKELETEEKIRCACGYTEHKKRKAAYGYAAFLK